MVEARMQGSHRQEILRALDDWTIQHADELDAVSNKSASEQLDKLVENGIHIFASCFYEKTAWRKVQPYAAANTACG